MAIILFNPTKEEFLGMHGGVEVKIAPFGKPGHKIKIDDAKARHILNQFGVRGLTTLEYGDEGEREEQKAKAGRKRNREFKEKQVLRYNRENESKKIRGIEYSEPTDQVKGYAKELGMGLLKPYDIPDAANKEISGYKEELFKRDEQILNLSKQVEELMNAVKSGLMPKNPEERAAADLEFTITEAKQTYMMMKWDDFKAHVDKPNTQREYATWPVEVQDHFRAKWLKLADEGMPFPY